MPQALTRHRCNTTVQHSSKIQLALLNTEDSYVAIWPSRTLSNIKNSRCLHIPQSAIEIQCLWQFGWRVKNKHWRPAWAGSAAAAYDMSMSCRMERKMLTMSCKSQQSFFPAGLCRVLGNWQITQHHSSAETNVNSTVLAQQQSFGRHKMSEERQEQSHTRDWSICLCCIFFWWGVAFFVLTK